jgi:hypothetical protein
MPPVAFAASTSARIFLLYAALKLGKRLTKAVLTSLTGFGDAETLTAEAIADVGREVYSGIVSRRKLEVAINFATVEAEMEDLPVRVVRG